MKTTALAILLAVVGALTALPALETSMVLRQGGTNGQGGVYVVVEPGIGTITIYTVEGSLLSKHGSANFIQDLEFQSQFVVGERGESVYTALRTGSSNCKPSVDELLSMLPSKPTEAEVKNGLKSYQERARLAEDLFWKEDHPYDGVVRGALGATSLMLVIPCKRALLVYDIQKQEVGPVLAAVRNFAAELYVPQVLASSPTPTELLAQLPADVKKEQKTAIEDSLKALAEAGGALTLKPSEPWVGVGTADRYVIIDPPNQHLMTYEYTGKGLRTASSRSMQVDLLIPTLMHSDPSEAAELKQFATARKQALAEAKIIPDIFYFKALVSQKQVPSSKTSDLQANVTNDDLVIDFLKLHKLFTYKLYGAGNGLELAAMRDYTLDVGLQLQEGEFADIVNSRTCWAQVKAQLGARQPTLAFRSFKLALSINPCLYKELEKEPTLKSLKADADFQPTWDAAMKGCEALMKERADRNKAAQDARDAAAKAAAAPK
jgi:hypothetical protein